MNYLFYLRLGNLNNAANDFKSALAINPSYQNSINGLVEIERMKNKNES